MNTKLAARNCQRIIAGSTPLAAEQVKSFLAEIPQWTLKGDAIEREFNFKDFQQSMDFANRVAKTAQQQDHHPDILISYARVGVTLSTHKVHGLTENDFILAAKIDLLF